MNNLVSNFQSSELMRTLLVALIIIGAIILYIQQDGLPDTYSALLMLSVGGYFGAVVPTNSVTSSKVNKS